LKRAILGLGQSWRSEDRFGIAALEYLKAQPDLLGHNCDFLISEGNITDLTDYFQNYEKILIIDAIWFEDNSQTNGFGKMREATEKDTYLGNLGRSYPRDKLICVRLKSLLEDRLLDKNIGTHFFSLKEVYLITSTLGLLKAEIDFLGFSIENCKIEDPADLQERFPLVEVKQIVLNWLRGLGPTWS
jgi:hypothetical protein